MLAVHDCIVWHTEGTFFLFLKAEDGKFKNFAIVFTIKDFHKILYRLQSSEFSFLLKSSDGTRRKGKKQGDIGREKYIWVDG